jgi:plasmid stabilization system protein ParE
MKVFVSGQADAGLLQIFRYFADRNPAAAGSFVRDIDRKFESSGIRSIVSNTQVIFYMVEGERINIVRVLDGRRDIDAEFQR